MKRRETEAEMGIFHVRHVRIGVGHPVEGELTQVLALVDTGATHTIIPKSLLRQILHIEPKESDITQYADGSAEQVDLGEARIGYDGRTYVCPVVFGPEDQYILGAIALESFRLVVDPLRKELVPARYVVRPCNHGI